MATLLAYCDPISAVPGDAVRAMVSCEGAATYRADIVRLYSPEASPEAPPFREEVFDCAVNGEHPGRAQPTVIGSFVEIPPSARINDLDGFSILATIWPTLPGDGVQALIGNWDDEARSGFALYLDAAGRLALRVGDGRETFELCVERPLTRKVWYQVAATLDAATGRLVLWQTPLSANRFLAEETMSAQATTEVRPRGTGPLLIAAWRSGNQRVNGLPDVAACYSGKIEAPRIAERAFERAELARFVGPDWAALPLATDVVAAWDFAIGIDGDTVTDTSANRLDGETRNLPARAMTGHNWTGDEHDWRVAPEQYGAIHFHEDDLDDARWQPDLELTIPDDMPSGIYAWRLRADDAEYHVPFYVRPPRGETRSAVAYLASTATHAAYINNVARFVSAYVELYQGRLTVVDETDMLLLEHTEIGLSTYDVHRDGSGVCYSSRLRPATNIRPKGRLWNFSVDMFIVDWLAQCYGEVDVITDEDLHLEGLDLLRDYRVVLTGSHPEYYSAAMLDGLDAWLRRGGRMMYMGGNGFYWRIAHHPDNPAIIEVRRAEDGVRAWIAEPGEYHHSFTGEHGGLWRRQGRAPNKIAGVGFISQGFDASTYYRRLDAADDPRVSFIFEGVEDDILGDFGEMRDGAAGIEIDCISHDQGTPPHALVVARSENHSNTYEIVAEEIAVPHGMTDGAHNPVVHADMTFFETPGGGAVFATGSIAYAGALGWNNFDNNIARLTTNVLRRFADPTPFEMPEED
ncbi:MAG: LamG-like jellyroll fold domain-containing protein [Alphaproteobacteria bacterium]